MSIQSWAVRFANTPTGDGDWGMPRGRWLLVRRLRQLVEAPLALTEEQWDRLAWNAAFYGAGPLWDAREPIEARLALLDNLAALAIRCAHESAEGAGGVFMYWDVLVHQLLYDPPMRNALFDVLTAQAALPNRHLQMSALHGLNHLLDARTPDFVRSISSRLADDEVREFAAAVATFSLP